MSWVRSSDGGCRSALSGDAGEMAAIGEMQGSGNSAAWNAQKVNVLRVFEEFRNSKPELTEQYPTPWSDLPEEVLVARARDRAFDCACVCSSGAHGPYTSSSPTSCSRSTRSPQVFTSAALNLTVASRSHMYTLSDPLVVFALRSPSSIPYSE